MISVVLQSRRFCIGTKKGFRDRALSCGGGSGGNARCGDNKTAENIYKRDMPSNSETSKKTAMQDKTENQAIG